MNRSQRESLAKLIQAAPRELRKDADRLLPLLEARRKKAQEILPREDQIPLPVE